MQNCKFSTTALSVEEKGGAVVFKVSPRKGSFSGMPVSRRFSAAFHLDAKPASAQLNGKPAEGRWDEAARTFTVALGEFGGNGAELVLRR